MINCIIIDDEQHAVDLLTGYINKVPLLELKYASTNPVDAFQYLQTGKTDLIFLDIQMPELDGIRLLRLLQGRSKVILTTAYSEYAIEGYEHDIVDYLLKPIVFERFLKAVQKAIHHLNTISFTPDRAGEKPGDDNDFIFVKSEGRSKIVKVLLNDIDFVESKGNYVMIHTSSANVMTLLSMKELEEKLPAEHFVRIHNSYLVPVNKISEVEGNRLQIGKHELPIGDVYKKAFLSVIEKYILKGRS